VPGGHLDHGEKPEDCAAREAREEVGVEVTGLRFRGITSDVFEDTGLHYITLWFEADHASGDPAVAAPDELDAVGWYGWDNLPRPLFLPLENYTAGRAYRP
jgi:8-oxo-dGTP diphosphatase